MDSNINIPEYGVTQFNKAIKDIIEDHFSYVRIKGEISEIRVATKGQIYITVKDSNSILSAVVWEQKKRSLTFEPEIGMEVILTGRVTTWSKFKTTYQIDVDKIEIAGEGALLKIIEERKKRLKEKGYFNKEIKKKIPYLPSRIGVITSPTGSVIHDIINRISERFKTPVDLWPVAVQGTEAPMSIIEAIDGFNSIEDHNRPDVIIIARGGGSKEDLMAFNDEQLAEAVNFSDIPIISAIGHETDTTIIDYIADLRASTPTAAAELVVPVKLELINIVESLNQRMIYGMDNKFKENLSNLNNLISYLKTPKQIISSFKDRLNFIGTGLKRNLKNNIEIFSRDLSTLTSFLKIPNELINFNQSKIKSLSKNLHSLVKRELISNSEKFKYYVKLVETNSIQSNLRKGYSIISKNKKIINKSGNISENDNLDVRFMDRSVEIKIKKIN
ncbi:MAG: exodeoxyribonuclease VII large subunit [Rickettsiales bacterium]|nr:exodeoxyribonuclease VII large subunit [Rickettsiales bacterium]|tara:strand:- start:214 stop:1548 length:1335 start_codon:yes stop_codon:yes gene_type:complete